MKQFVKKALLPLVVFVVAVVSAFAVNTTATMVLQAQPLYNGPFCYVHPMNGCTNVTGLNPITLNCTLTSTIVLCTVNVSGIGNVTLNECNESPPASGIWICTRPLFKRTVI